MFEAQTMYSDKFIVVSDLHLNIYSKYSQPCDDVNTRFHHQRIILREIFQLARKYQAGVVFDGDLFDQRANPDCRVVQLAVEEISRGKKLIGNQDVFILTGNHDEQDNSRKPANSINIFKYLKEPIHVVDTPSVYHKPDTGCTAYFIPYSEDKKWLQSYLNKWSQSNVTTFRVLFAHIGVAGAKMGAHLVRLSGEFSLKDLHHNFFQLIVMGHYHRRQYLTKDKKVLYVGNTIPLRHEDDGQKKGVSLINVHTSTEKFIPLKSPMFYTFKAKDLKDPNKIINLAKTNFVRVVASNKLALDKYAKAGVDTVYQPKHEYKARLNIKATSTSKQIASEYCDHYAPKAKATALTELEKAKKQEDNS